MRYTLVIQTAPFSGTAAMRALLTARAILKAGDDITRLFFYQDGVFNAGSLQVPAQDLPDLPLQWQGLITDHGLDAVVCVSSALQRGILTDGEARRYDKTSSSICDAFTLGGLGLLVDALTDSDHTLVFG